MIRARFWIGVGLSVMVLLWGAASQVFAHPKADHTNNGKAHAQQAAHVNGHANGHSGSATTSGAPITSSGSSPVGNNGTVKIDNYSDGNGNDVAPNNEPHVSCSWGVDAYGYEAAVASGTETFVQWAPTRGGSAQEATLTNEHPRGTGRTWNGSTDNSLTLSGTPHPKQGFHVKLTFTAPDGNTNGSTVKHKVFWVQPCQTGVTTGGDGSVLGTSASVTSFTGAGFFTMRSAARTARTARPGKAVAASPGFTG